jgi:hypothetical protein
MASRADNWCVAATYNGLIKDKIMSTNAAKNLRAIWESKSREKGFTQVSAASKLGWTQGAISQYINDLTDLSAPTVVKFANFLGVHPLEIDPDIEDKLPEVSYIPSLTGGSGSLYKLTSFDTVSAFLNSSSCLNDDPLPPWMQSCAVELTSNLRAGYAKADQSAAKCPMFATIVEQQVNLFTADHPVVRDGEQDLYRVVSVIPTPNI